MGASASWAQTYTQPSGKRALSQGALSPSGMTGDSAVSE